MDQAMLNMTVSCVQGLFTQTFLRRLAMQMNKTNCFQWLHLERQTVISGNSLPALSKLRLFAKCHQKSGHKFYLHTAVRSDQAEFGSSEIAGMRKAYKGQQDIFDIDKLVSKEPFGQFTAWFEEAQAAAGIMEANAMALSTATSTGKPSVRMVLMKGIDEKGIVFYTNYFSRKGQELSENPHCCLMFYWEPLMKCVRIEGKVEQVSDEESTQYFHSRPRSSQIGACVSVKQSSLVESREALDKRNEELNEMYADENTPIPKPDYWGGFRVVPHFFEFWQGQTNRIHDRIVFRRPVEGEATDAKFTHQGENGWVYERLMP